jgi:hypothetical protein
MDKDQKPKFRYLIVDGGDISGTNDKSQAELYDRTTDVYVYDVVLGVRFDGDFDENSVEEIEEVEPLEEEEENEEDD